MPPLDAPSPTPSNLTSTAGIKRPRPSATAPTAGPSRTKRRKPEDAVDDESGRGRQPVNFGVGMVKGKEDEWGEPADVTTKIDFNTLPDETLYRYLEYHDLLPRWDASPWSEDPCTPPNALYTLAPAPPNVPIVPEPTDKPAEPADSRHTAGHTNVVVPKAAAIPVPGAEDPNPDAPIGEDIDPSQVIEVKSGETEHEQEGENAGVEGEGTGLEGEDEEPVVAPTTRSKTAPFRRQLTPPPTSPSPPTEIKRGVITLSDVHAARAALAEKANAHWVKGLGGGQNKEGETIVQFLYKMKAGPGRLLRVYNPFPPPLNP